MSTWELLLICLGLSFDVYAINICEGAMLKKIEGKDVLALCGIFLVCQLAAIGLGSLISLIFDAYAVSYTVALIWRIISLIIIFALGCSLLVRGIRNKLIAEKSKKLRYRDVLKLAAVSAVDILLACMGLGGWNVNVCILTAFIAGSTLLAVVAGIFTGYRLGYEQKRKAYFSGSAFLIGACVLIFAREIL